MMKFIPWGEAKEVALALLTSGVAVERVIEEIVEFVDGAVDWRKLLGGLVGRELEKRDDDIIRICARAVVKIAVRELSR